MDLFSIIILLAFVAAVAFLAGAWWGSTRSDGNGRDLEAEKFALEVNQQSYERRLKIVKDREEDADAKDRRLHAEDRALKLLRQQNDEREAVLREGLDMLKQVNEAKSTTTRQSIRDINAAQLGGIRNQRAERGRLSPSEAGIAPTQIHSGSDLATGVALGVMMGQSFGVGAPSCAPEARSAGETSQNLSSSSSYDSGSSSSSSSDSGSSGGGSSGGGGD